MKLFICGFMGSGKSYLYKQWKNSLKDTSLDFVEFDEVLVDASSYQSIEQWVANVGWEEFRAAESQLLKDILEKRLGGIYSLGGGTLTEQSLKLIRESEDAKLLWVDTDFPTCWSRIEKDLSRPLVQKGKDFCENLFKERERLYEKADFHLSKLCEQELSDLFDSL